MHYSYREKQVLKAANLSLRIASIGGAIVSKMAADHGLHSTSLRVLRGQRYNLALPWRKFKAFHKNKFMSQQKRYRPKNDADPNPHQNGGEKESTKRHVYVEPGVQIDFVESLRRKYESDQEQSTVHNARVLLWTKISAGLLFVVIVIYYLQLRAMVSAVTATRQASEREQRAWLTVKANNPNASAAASVYSVYPLRIENIGNTPERHVQADVWIKLIPIEDEPDLSENRDSKYGAGYRWDIGELTPKDHFDTDATRRRYRDLSKDPEPWPTDGSEQASVNEGQKYVVIYAVVNYDDVFRAHHTTRFCTWRSNAHVTPAFKCSEYNKSDDSDEP